MLCFVVLFCCFVGTVIEVVVVSLFPLLAVTDTVKENGEN